MAECLTVKLPELNPHDVLHHDPVVLPLVTSPEKHPEILQIAGAEILERLDQLLWPSLAEFPPSFSYPSLDRSS